MNIKYLEPTFTAVFLNALRGLDPDGQPDAAFRGRELARNAAIGEPALSTGHRLQEFRFLLVYEIPALPAHRSPSPIQFPMMVASATAPTWRQCASLATPQPCTGIGEQCAAQKNGGRSVTKGRDPGPFRRNGAPRC